MAGVVDGESVERQIEDFLQKREGPHPESQTDAAKEKRAEREMKRGDEDEDGLQEPLNAMFSGEEDMEEEEEEEDLEEHEGQEETSQDHSSAKEQEGFPFEQRNVSNTARMLQAWIGKDYGCPYEGCTYLSYGCRRKNVTVDGQFHKVLVVRPGRWAEMQEHWWANHMSHPLSLTCPIESCNRANKPLKSTRRLAEHLRGPHKMTLTEANLRVKAKMSDLALHCGKEVPNRELIGVVKWPQNQMTVAVLKRKLATAPKANAPSAVKASVPTKRPATDASASTSKKQRVEGPKPCEDIYRKLDVGPFERVSSTARNNVRGTICFIKSRIQTLVSVAVDKAIAEFDRTSWSKKGMAPNITDMRALFYQGRDLLDEGARTMDEWLTQMGGSSNFTPTQTLVNEREVSALKEALKRSEADLNKHREAARVGNRELSRLKIEIKDLQRQVGMHPAPMEVTAPTTAAAASFSGGFAEEDAGAVAAPHITGVVSGVEPNLGGLNVGPPGLSDRDLVALRCSLLTIWEHYLLYKKMGSLSVKDNKE